jgi:hypothetical protein
VDALARGRPHRAKLKELMAKKVRLLHFCAPCVHLS